MKGFLRQNDAPLKRKKRSKVAAYQSEQYGQAYSVSSEPSSNGLLPRQDFVGPLLQWAVDAGIEFADGVEVMMKDSSSSDVSVVATRKLPPGSAIVSFPSYVILSSEAYETSPLKTWMTSEVMNPTYAPEFLLILRFLEEFILEEGSSWYPWIKSLPNEFSNCLYMTELELSHLRRLAPKFLEEQGQKWNDCLSVFWKLGSLPEAVKNGLSPALQQRLSTPQELERLLKWGYSVVFTRSWRTPDGRHATLVPIGDLFNHHNEDSNLRPSMHFDGNNQILQLCLTETIPDSTTYDKPMELYLSYGIAYEPARFLVSFGFCDTSSAFVTAQVDHFLQRQGFPPLSDARYWPVFDESKLLVATDSGSLAEDVWRVFLLQYLMKEQPSEVETIQSAYDKDSDDALEEAWEMLLSRFEDRVSEELANHFQDLLDTVYVPINYDKELSARNPQLAMIAEYSTFMRNVLTRTLKKLT